jgi:tRNA A37 threonylcarbamoyladenosine modification protein TsaB
VATDARRREVYWRTASDEPAVGRPADVAAALRERGVTRVAGQGPRLYPDAFAGFDVGDEYPDAARLLDAERRDLTPLYLRRPDATPPGAPKKVTA